MGEWWPAESSFGSVVERARALDHAALSLLYRRYLPIVYRYVLGRIGNEHLAEDVTSETFIGMVDAIERVRASDELGFAGWLLGIARHKVAEHLRRQAAQPTMQSTSEPWDEPLASAEEGDPLGIVTARESWAEVVAALEGLTDEQRTVLSYRLVLGYETEEVARLLDRQPGAIRALQFRALTALTRLLAASGTHPAAAALRARLGGSARSPRVQRSGNAPRR